MTKESKEEPKTAVVAAAPAPKPVVLSGQHTDQSTGEVTMANFSVPSDMLDEIAGMSDLGYSENSEDSMIPILAILQDNSAEVKKKHSKYIEGAEPGDLIIRSLARVIKMGDNIPPIVVQPAGFDHVWVEWQGEPGEGAPVGQFAFENRPADAVETEDPQNPDRKMWRLPNGNRLVDTRYHYVNVLSDDGSAMPAVIPMSGTNHTTSRSWTAQMKQHLMPGKSVKAPSFFRQYGIKTKFRQRGEQSWYTYTVGDLGWIVDEGVLRAGLSLLRGIRDNTLSVESEGAAVERTTSDDSIPI